MIDVTFLGTSGAVPTARRNHPAVHLKYKAEDILFDCGEGTQRQFRKAHLNPCKLTRLFITHWHGDHILGIPGLLYTLGLNGYNKTLEIYGPRGTKKYMGLMMRLFANVQKLNVKIHEVSAGKIVDTDDFEIHAKSLIHGAPTLAYSFIEKEKLRIDKKKLAKLKLPNSPEMQKLKKGKDAVINGKKIKAKSITYVQPMKKIAIVLDIRYNSSIVSFVKDSDLFISEATYLDEVELAKDHNHMTAGQATDIAKKAKVKKLILMHLSQRYERDEKKFLREAKKKFKKVEIAKDLDKVEI